MRGTPYHDHNYSELDDQFEEESTDPNPLPALLIATPVNPTRANTGIVSDNTSFNLQCFDPKRHLPYWACVRALSVRATL